jgi:hypothetical protein
VNIKESVDEFEVELAAPGFVRTEWNERIASSGMALMKDDFFNKKFFKH